MDMRDSNHRAVFPGPRCGYPMQYALTACFLFLFAGHLAAQEYNGSATRVAAQRTDRIIVKWKDPSASQSKQQKMQALKLASRHAFRLGEQVAPQMDVLQLEHALTVDELAQTLAILNADASVEFASPDLRRRLHALPNDTLMNSQWYLLTNEIAALRAELAWDLSTGSAGTVVAVLDTGVRFDHPDLSPAAQGGKLLPGYDFVSGESSSSFLAANDGNGRDADPSDPGDWVNSTDANNPIFEDCKLEKSSWHGTRVAGVIGARTGNNEGMAGVAWNTWILPVRVMGKCGGRDSDIMAAMRWAAGLEVPGVPTNPYPANIINLSLGGDGSCTSAYQNVASELAARGVLIVASAGNEGGAVSAPANCNGVLGVTGARHVGTKVGFSNLGPTVGIAAPGGNCVNVGGGDCLFSIITTTNLGETTPQASGYTDQALNFNVGTSFSAPLVAGTAALMHAANARLGPQHLITRIKQGATPFPANPDPATIPTCRVPGPTDVQDFECSCTTETCGAGLLNAHSAVTHAMRPAAAVAIAGVVAPGQTVTLDASASAAACNQQISSYSWSIVSPTTNPPALSATDQAQTTLQAPASGEAIVRVTVTDAQGAQDSADVIIGPASASTTAPPLVEGSACPVPITIAQTPAPSPPTPAPVPPSNGGGGGGQFSWELFALGIAWLFTWRRRMSFAARATVSQTYASISSRQRRVSSASD